MISIYQMTLKQIIITSVATVAAITAIGMGVNFSRTGNVLKFTKSPVSETVKPKDKTVKEKAAEEGSETERKAAVAKKAYDESVATKEAADKAMLDARFKYVEAEKKRKREAEAAAGRDSYRVERAGRAARRLVF